MCLANRFRHLRHLVHCCLYFPLLFSLLLAPHARSTRKKTAPLATLTTTRGSFLESPDNKRRAVVVYIQDRGINSFANNMIKLSARTRLFDLNTCIWFRARETVPISFSCITSVFRHYFLFQIQEDFNCGLITSYVTTRPLGQHKIPLFRMKMATMK